MNWKKVCAVLVLGAGMVGSAIAQEELYRDPLRTADERARDLLSRMTLDEKLSQMKNVAAGVERLGIERYDWWNEALHGVGRAGLATVFPQAIGLAATFDDAAVRESFDLVSDEARAKHVQARAEGNYKRYTGLTFWTPNINIFRDPRWGRGQETYGEDPYLTARMGVAVVQGLQGDGASVGYDKTHACAKHYAVHSGPEWNRHSFDAKQIAPRDLWETYLPAFKALVQEAHVREVMCAYNRFEGEPCCGSNQLLVRILRNEWGYDGIVVSDCGAVTDFHAPAPEHHHTHETAELASAAAVATGTDLECGSSYDALKAAVEQGLVSEEQIDASVFRLLRARFQLGMFDDPGRVPWNEIPYEVVDSPEHRAKALEMARKSLVLLSNRNAVLPLDKGVGRIAVLGPNADDAEMMWGNYNGTPSHTVTMLEGIRAKLPAAEVRYAKGCNHADGVVDEAAVAACVEGADAIVFVGGISPRIEGEEMKVSLPGFRNGDRTAIELPQVQLDLLRRLKQTGKPVILVLCAGSAVALPDEEQLADAVLDAWYPGQAGGTAVADVLFGDYNPAGRLPVTFYAATEDLPDFEDYRMEGRTYRYFRGTPRYAFGHGLSYTTFAYGTAKASATRIACGEPVTLAIPLTNSGSRDGDEVVQVYVRRKGDTAGPIKSLRAFRRVQVAAGTTQTVEVELGSRAFETFDPATERMALLPGTYEVLYGGTSEEAGLKRLEIKVKK